MATCKRRLDGNTALRIIAYEHVFLLLKMSGLDILEFIMSSETGT